MRISAPLSSSQYGIYAECVSHQGEIFYNLPYMYILDGSLDGERLRAAVEAAVKAHPTLFTRIEQAKDGLVRPFELYGGRLFNIRLMKDGKHFYLFTDFHHIIVDGTSMQIILKDIDKAYAGEKLEPEVVTMAEIAKAEAGIHGSEAFAKGKEWYSKTFDCGDTSTPLLPDLEVPGASEGHLLRTLDVEMSRLDAFCKENGIFRSTVFTAAYSLLLARFNNEKESYYTTVYNGRKDKSYARTVGMTVRTIPVYAKFDDDTTVLDFLRSAQEMAKGCREHDAYTSLVLSLTVIPVLWAMAKWMPEGIWYSYLIAYIIEAIIIGTLHKAFKIKFELTQIST
jgi:hypothetical protein